MVMETGIGGRFDSTNALGVPEVAIITKIGFDHMAILGNTLEEIAGEKAGIIKKGCPVVSATQQSKVQKVLHAEFEKENAKDSKVAKFMEVMRNDLLYVDSIPRKMLGSFQVENAATAMLAAREIFAKWEPVLTTEAIEQYIRAGIAATVWKGRMELVNENPFFLIDGAHNSHGVHALASGLKELYPEEKFHFIMGVMADKDYEEMIDELLPLAIDFVTVTPESNRALQAEDLAECIAKKGVKASYSRDVEAVIAPLVAPQSAKSNRNGKNEKTVAFGSLYFIGEIEKLVMEHMNFYHN